MLLFDQRGEKLFCVRELLGNVTTGKVVGSFSVPCETIRSGETREKALERLIIEEVDSSGSLELEKASFMGSVPLSEGAAVAHVYVTRLIEGADYFFGMHAGVEIEPIGFLSREELLSNCRAGMQEILSLYSILQEHAL